MFGPAKKEAATGLPRDCTFAADRWQALAQQWHPIAAASVVSPGPVAATLLDERLVSWRGGDRVSVAKDLCIHRGAQLSPGTVKAGELICPYHGFRYSPGGACVLAPCTGSAATALPAKLHLIMYGTAESSGLVWVRLASEGPPAPPDLGDFGTGAEVWSAAWKAPARLAVEGILDLARAGESPEAPGWRVRTIGPFSGTIDGPGRTAFAIQPISRTACGLFLAGAAAPMAGKLLERLQPVVESLPATDGASSEALLAGDLPVASYRQALIALGLD